LRSCEVLVFLPRPVTVLACRYGADRNEDYLTRPTVVPGRLLQPHESAIGGSCLPLDPGGDVVAELPAGACAPLWVADPTAN
jgi:hypothetical protein